MIIFRELEEAVQTVHQRLLRGSEVEDGLDAQRLRLLHDIAAYVRGYAWLSHTKSKERIKLFLKYRYQYGETAAALGVSRKSLEQSVSYAAKQLSRRIGDNTIDLIMEGQLELARQEFLLGTGALAPSDWFVGGIMERFPAKKDAGVALHAAGRELAFLLRYTRRQLDLAASSLDSRVMAHLLYVLSATDASYMQERNVLLQCLVSGTLSPGEALQQLQRDDIYAD
jgi:hypothetical protein